MRSEIVQPVTRGLHTAVFGLLGGVVIAWIVLSVAARPLPAASRPATTASSNATTDRGVVRLEVVGPRQLTLPEAWQAAEALAMEKLTQHFQEVGVPISHMPTMTELRPLLARHWKYKEDNEFRGQPVNQTVHWVSLDIPVMPEVRTLLVQKEREHRMQERMLWVGRILAGLVVLLIAAAGYFRLDDWTKGYYTSWLRMAAIGFIGTCVLALLLFA